MENTFWLLGMQRTIIAEGDQTHGQYDLIETVAQPGGQTPPHIHHQYAETEYVIEGELTIFTDTEMVVLRPGQGYTIPKGKPHALAASATTPTKMLTVFSPAGFARIIRLAGKKAEDPTRSATDMVLFNQLCDEIGDVTIGAVGSRP